MILSIVTRKTKTENLETTNNEHNNRLRLG